MVSIKSLVVLLFAAAVTAIPVAGGDGHGSPIPVAGGDHHGSPVPAIGGDGHGNTLPVAGGDGHGANVHTEDNSQSCPAQYQNMSCCNEDTNSKTAGSYVGILNDIDVYCNDVTSNVIAVDAVSGQAQCSGKMACCESEDSQNGVVNAKVGCIAWAGPN